MTEGHTPEPPSARHLAVGASLLTVATAAHKVAMFVMKARLGQLGGAETLGAATSVLTLTWMIAAVSHLGIPDHAMVRAAISSDTEAARGGARHGLFLGTAVVAGGLAMSLAAAPSARPGLAALLVVGAITQHAAGVALLTFRGRGRPVVEALTLLVASLVLLAGGWAATEPAEVAASYAVQGTVFLVALAVCVGALPELRPRWPASSVLLAEVRKSLPIFTVGVTSMWLESTDIVATQLTLGEASVGELSGATLMLRTGLQVPWLAGTLVLARLHRSHPSAKELIGGLVGVGALLALASGLVAYLSRGFVSQALGLPLELFEDALFRALVLAPPYYVAVLALPIAMTLALRDAVRVTLLTFALTAVAALGLGSLLGLAGVQLGHAAGQLFFAVGLLVALARSTGRRPSSSP